MRGLRLAGSPRDARRCGSQPVSAPRRFSRTRVARGYRAVAAAGFQKAELSRRTAALRVRLLARPPRTPRGAVLHAGAAAALRRSFSPRPRGAAWRRGVAAASPAPGPAEPARRSPRVPLRSGASPSAGCSHQPRPALGFASRGAGWRSCCCGVGVTLLRRVALLPADAVASPLPRPRPAPPFRAFPTGPRRRRGGCAASPPARVRGAEPATRAGARGGRAPWRGALEPDDPAASLREAASAPPPLRAPRALGGVQPPPVLPRSDAARGALPRGGDARARPAAAVARAAAPGCPQPRRPPSRPPGSAVPTSVRSSLRAPSQGDLRVSSRRLPHRRRRTRDPGPYGGAARDPRARGGGPCARAGRSEPGRAERPARLPLLVSPAPAPAPGARGITQGAKDGHLSLPLFHDEQPSESADVHVGWKQAPSK